MSRVVAGSLVRVRSISEHPYQYHDLVMVHATGMMGSEYDLNFPCARDLAPAVGEDIHVTFLKDDEEE